MNPIAREKLIALVAKFGRSIIDDHKRCEALLSDVYGDQYELELFVLLAALKERIPSELVSGSGGVSKEVLFGKLATRLAVKKGFKEDLARWGVESWGIALGVLSESPKGSERKGPQSSSDPIRKAIGGQVPLRPTQTQETKDVKTFPEENPNPLTGQQTSSTPYNLHSLGWAAATGVVAAAVWMAISIWPKTERHDEVRSSFEEELRKAWSPTASPTANSSVGIPSGGLFTNTLGMVFTRVPGGPMFSIWDVRVMDYGVYAAANPGADTSWKYPGFVQGPDHPVVNVSWDDAQAFCTWLTKKERGEGRIKADQSYRLPTDAEWSVAVGLEGEVGSTPREKEGKIKGVYPWGRQWPPPKGAGNYDPALGADDYDYTSPVGSFKPNKHGLYDMGGNVWQWCEDRYEGEQISRVLRGASWNYVNPGILLSSYRDISNPGFRLSNVGFRCVLVGVGSL